MAASWDARAANQQAAHTRGGKREMEYKKAQRGAGQEGLQGGKKKRGAGASDEEGSGCPPANIPPLCVTRSEEQACPFLL